MQKMILLGMTVIYRKLIKHLSNMLRTDQLHFSCEVSDWTTENCNVQNFKELDLQKKKEQFGYINKRPTWCKLCSLIYFIAKSFYMFRVTQHPSSRVLKTVTAASGTGHTVKYKDLLELTNKIYVVVNFW